VRIPSLIRFLLEAAFLVLVVAVAGVAGLEPLWIGLALLGAWLLVALVEASTLRRSRHRRGHVAEVELARELKPPPQPMLVTAQPPSPQPSLEREPGPEPEVVPTNRQEPTPRVWNLWELEQLAEEMNGDARAEERTLLLLHLREFADPSGDLPLEFDPLVRDAFGTGLAELVT
jgi:hypothetical protein